LRWSRPHGTPDRSLTAIHGSHLRGTTAPARPDCPDRCSGQPVPLRFRAQQPRDCIRRRVQAGARNGRRDRGHDAGLWRLQREALPNATVVLDWWHAAVRFEHALRAARGLGVADTHLAADAVCGVERAKWRLWHGRWPGCRRKLAALCRWARRTSIRGKPGIRRLEHHVGELLVYLERNQGALVHYAARRRSGELISTAFVESAVNEIIAKRMNKKQQMRWNRATVQPFLDVRTAVLSDTLRGRILSSLSRLPPRKRRGSRHIGGVMNPRIACSPAYQENMPVDLSRLYSGRARAPGSVTPRAMSARLAARGQRS
jgi:hypothetical protein